MSTTEVRRARWAGTVGAGVALLSALAACSATSAAVSSPAVVTGPASRSAVPTLAAAPPSTQTVTRTPGPTAKPTSTTVPASPGTSSGCPRTTATVPVSAARRGTVDVDGDGRRDVVWLAPAPGGDTRLGFTTASGATFETAWASASPVGRSALVARPTPAGQVIVLGDDGRLVELFTVVGCRVAPVRNVGGQQYQFAHAMGNGGTGVGCLGPGNRAGLTGLDARTIDRTHISVRRTFVEVTGTRARNGTSDSLTATLPADQRLIDSAHNVTCGDLTLATDGVTRPEG